MTRDMSCVIKEKKEPAIGLEAIAIRNKKGKEERSNIVCLGARMLLGAPGLTTRSKKLLEAPGIATRSKDAKKRKKGLIQFARLGWRH